MAAHWVALGMGDVVLKLVLTQGVDVAHVTHLGRGPSAAQRVALLWSSPTCTVEGNAVRRPRRLTGHTARSAARFEISTPFLTARLARSPVGSLAASAYGLDPPGRKSAEPFSLTS
jgi:hypothetical protein